MINPEERLPTLGELQALAEVAHHGSYKDAAYCLGHSPNTIRNQAYHGFHRLDVTTTLDALSVLGWVTIPPVLLGCIE